MAVAKSVFPILKRGRGFGRGVGLVPQRPAKLPVFARTETKNRCREILLSGWIAATPDHLARIEPAQRFEREMSLTDENGAGFEVVVRLKQGNCPGLEHEGSHVQRQ